MKTLASVLHTKAAGTASRIGWSSVSKFDECAYAWALSELVPHPKGGTGIKGGEARAPFIGSRFHDALAGWYTTAALADFYNMGDGLEALHKGGAAARDNVGSDEDWAQWMGEAEELWVRYAKECGDGGPDPDRERFQVASDEQGPLVEREFEVDLGYAGYYYTTRMDCVGWDGDGQLIYVEHKTHDVSRRAAELAGYQIDPQISGGVLALHGAFGATLQAPPQAVVNCVWKRAAAKSPCRTWEPLERTELDLQKFKLDMIRKLKRMDESVAEYKDLLAKGVEPLRAIYLVFDGTRKKSTCADQGRKCSFYDACYRRSTVRNWLAGTDPKYPILDVDNNNSPATV